MEAKDILKKPDDRQICRALISPSENQEWDFEAIAIPSENKQLRYSYQNDEYFYQVLRTGKENIKPERLDSGLPLFDNHPWEQSAMNTLGITVGYEFTEQGVVVRGKFGARADQQLRDDVKNGIIKTVSIEGQVINYTIERKEGEIPVYYADLWEAESLSFAPVPQDISSQIEVKRALIEQIERSKTPENDSFIKKLIKKF